MEGRRREGGEGGEVEGGREGKGKGRGAGVVVLGGIAAPSSAEIMQKRRQNCDDLWPVAEASTLRCTSATPLDLLIV